MMTMVGFFFRAEINYILGITQKGKLKQGFPFWLLANW